MDFRTSTIDGPRREGQDAANATIVVFNAADYRTSTVALIDVTRSVEAPPENVNRRLDLDRSVLGVSVVGIRLLTRGVTSHQPGVPWQSSVPPRSENASLAALRAGQKERIEQAKAYRRDVGDPVEILTMLLPLLEGEIASIDDDVDKVE